ncbi:MAG: CPBP family intramembrane metalloprotease [Oscillospiraceae bacterium]|nr:CPBP family intramembrane metalloprotease [Oscillospiraceae bacterium]
MRRLYEKKELLFALLWILAYCLVMAPVKGRFGYASPWMLLALLVFAAGIAAFVRSNHLEKKYGLARWPRDTKRFLCFLPMWILATGNLWDGFAPSYQGAAQLIAVLSMILVGFVEEMLFRGFLFRALITKEKAVTAIVITSLTFGMGHIVNLLAGQASLETAVQMVFAVVWGFILTMVLYKSGSLLPCILAHAMIDVFSLFGADVPLVDAICIGATIVVGSLYCLYLSRLKTEKNGEQT